MKYIVRGILWLLGRLPLKVHYALSSFLAWFAGSVLRYRRDVVEINLARSFPDMKYGELKETTKKFYRHFADILAEAVFFGACNRKRLMKADLVSVANPEVLEEAMASSPSVVLLTSHCGNWEIIGGIIEYTPQPSALEADDCVVVYRKLSSKVWDEVMKKNRTAVRSNNFGGCIESSNIIRYIVEHRSEKKAYFLITDQNPYGGFSPSVHVDFLHQKAASMSAGAGLAKKFGFSVVYQYMRPVRRGHYEIEYTLITPDASSMTPSEIMERYYALLQRDIESVPWNYLWTHKRWK